jgi:predicted alpha/beta-hydrolase family hydrolase
MLFLQGSRDEFATWKLDRISDSSLPLAELIKIEGANHGFKAGKQDIIKLLATITKEWIEKRLARMQHTFLNKQGQ